MCRQPHDVPSRRGFLHAASVAAVGLAVPNLFAAADSKDDPFGDFTLGIQSYTFRNFDLEPCLRRIKQVGLHHVEFYQKHAPLASSPAQIKALLKLCKDYDVSVVCWGVQGFSKDHSANKRVFDFGKALGVRAFSADPTPDSFDSLDKLCEEYKIAIAIHPHGPVGNKLHRWYSAEVILKAVKDHHDLIGAGLDTGHLIRADQLGEKLDPAQQVRAMGSRNFGMHLKDHDNKRKTDVVFGRDGGVLDVVSILKALRDVKFKGHISIEYEANPEEPTRDVAACVAVFKEAVRRLS
jgi:sugar phosphate isomerase/epimerase